MIIIPLNLNGIDRGSGDYSILRNSEKSLATIANLTADERHLDALERSISLLRDLREFSDFTNTEFRTILAITLYSLAEIHFSLKDYKQSEKELNTLFTVLGNLVREDPDRYADFHIAAMQLAAGIIRSRKKTVEMLVKQRLLTEELNEKVSSGAIAATDRLTEAMRKLGELLAASGAYREALKVYADAIKLSKKKSGRVGRKEIKMTIEMAEIMSRIKAMRQRAKRLLAAVLPHSIALEIIELEENIVALIEMIDKLEEQPSKWKTFINTITFQNRRKKTDNVNNPEH